MGATYERLGIPRPGVAGRCRCLHGGGVTEAQAMERQRRACRPHVRLGHASRSQPEELASVQHEFNPPGPLVDDPNTQDERPVLEVSGDLVFAEIKTIRWVAVEEAVQIGKVQLVLGDGFVLTVDPDERPKAPRRLVQGQ
jgi:Mg2+ and Co2+ transporter CorA